MAKTVERFYGDWAATLPGVLIVTLFGVGLAVVLRGAGTASGPLGGRARGELGLHQG